jgi:protein-tyrosine phosphatase
MAMFARLPPDVIKALMGVDRRYIEASLAAIDARGGMDRYLREDMGLGPNELARLRALYLRP